MLRGFVQKYLHTVCKDMSTYGIYIVGRAAPFAKQSQQKEYPMSYYNHRKRNIQCHNILLAQSFTQYYVDVMSCMWECYIIILPPFLKKIATRERVGFKIFSFNAMLQHYLSANFNILIVSVRHIPSPSLNQTEVHNESSNRCWLA